MATPATRTARRTQIGLRLNAPAIALSTAASESPRRRSLSASDSPSSPSIFTKPPRGIQLTEYRVPCQTTEPIRGGKPTPNS